MQLEDVIFWKGIMAGKVVQVASDGGKDILLSHRGSQARGKTLALVDAGRENFATVALLAAPDMGDKGDTAAALRGKTPYLQVDTVASTEKDCLEVGKTVPVEERMVEVTESTVPA